MVCLKQAVLAHCMVFQFGPFKKLLSAVYPSPFPEPLQREESFVLEDGDWGSVHLQQNSFPEQLPSLRALEQNCTQGSRYNLLLLVWEDKLETSQSIC